MSIPLLFGDNRKKGGMVSGMPTTEVVRETVSESKKIAFRAFRTAFDARDDEAAAAALAKFISLVAPIPIKEDYGLDDPVNSARGT